MNFKMERQSTNPNSSEGPKLPNRDARGRFVENVEEQDVKMKIPLMMPPPPPPPAPIFMAPAETRKSTLNLDKAIEYELKHGRKLDPKMDRKKLRRTVSNRLSAQRSRVKKAQHIHEMERRVTELEDLISVLTVRVERYKEKKRLLQLQNEALERLVEIRRAEANHAQMVLEKNQAELARLKEVEKGLLRELIQKWNNNGGQPQQQQQQQQAGSSSSGGGGLMYGNSGELLLLNPTNSQLAQKQGDDVEMVDPFLNFDMSN